MLCQILDLYSTWRTDGGIRCLGRLGLAGRSEISGVALVSSFLPNIILDSYLDEGVVVDSCGQADKTFSERFEQRWILWQT